MPPPPHYFAHLQSHRLRLLRRKVAILSNLVVLALNGEVRGQVGGRAAAAAFADLIPAELRGLLQDITVMSRLEDEPALTVLPYHLKIR